MGKGVRAFGVGNVDIYFFLHVSHVSDYRDGAAKYSSVLAGSVSSSVLCSDFDGTL